MSDSKHWQAVYQTKDSKLVSWYRPHLEVSMDLLRKAGLNRNSRVIDVGAGASTLVDDLLDRSISRIAVLDISEASLRISRDRLGTRESSVNWIVSNVLDYPFEEDRYDLWHDRAVLHFLTDARDSSRYVECVRKTVPVGGHAIIGCFASDGPERCSGLPVVRRDPEQIAQLFGSSFSLVAAEREKHSTPNGSAQSFAYALLKKIS